MVRQNIDRGRKADALVVIRRTGIVSISSLGLKLALLLASGTGNNTGRSFSVYRSTYSLPSEQKWVSD
jgi:hypothetical protein